MRDDKDRDDIEKEIEALLEQIKKQDKKNKLLNAASYGLVPNFGLNILYMYLMNLLLFMVTTGLTSFLKVTEIAGFFIGVMLFTLLEIMFKMVIYRYLLKYVLQSFGLLLLLTSILLMYVSVYVTPGLEFIQIGHLIGFSILFLGLRMMLMYYLKTWLFNKRK